MKDNKKFQEKVEEVEFSRELADSADWEAVARMKAANQRAQPKKEQNQ
ncbi:YfhD family protein [bacterium LRH843]|nr:YfhD family protein [bacterium LRH843]